MHIIKLDHRQGVRGSRRFQPEILCSANHRHRLLARCAVSGYRLADVLLNPGAVRGLERIDYAVDLALLEAGRPVLTKKGYRVPKYLRDARLEVCRIGRVLPAIKDVLARLRPGIVGRSMGLLAQHPIRVDVRPRMRQAGEGVVDDLGRLSITQIDEAELRSRVVPDPCAEDEAGLLATLRHAASRTPR